MRHKAHPLPVIFVLALCFLLLAAQGRAAVNIGMANMGADPTTPDSDLITDSPPLTVTSTRLTVIKKAFIDENSGTEIANGSTVVKGTMVRFVIFIDNTTGSQATDVRIVDQLDKSGFTYEVGSLKWNSNVTASGAAVTTIFADTSGGVALTDAISGADIGSVDLAPPAHALITFGAHSTQTNGVFTIPAGKIASFMFRARVN